MRRSFSQQVQRLFLGQTSFANSRFQQPDLKLPMGRYSNELSVRHLEVNVVTFSSSPDSTRLDESFYRLFTTYTLSCRPAIQSLFRLYFATASNMASSSRFSSCPYDTMPTERWPNEGNPAREIIEIIKGTGYFSSRFAAGDAAAICSRGQTSWPLPLATLFFRMVFADSNTRRIHAPRITSTNKVERSETVDGFLSSYAR
jgi:hypothetical protein